MMALLRCFLVSLIIYIVISSPVEDQATRSIHLTPERIIEAGYHAERHHVTTPDGYILEMHRIPFKRQAITGDDDRPVVFLMHGLLGASNNFIFLGPENAIAFNLADAGFDVWMGNHRGTKNSRFHVTLDTDNSDHRRDFFDFSWEEVGMIDIPAMIDYILEVTGKEKIHYIGHSQGGTVFLVCTSMMPEYNKKFASVHLLAGVGYKEYFPNFLLRNLAQFTTPLWGLAQQLGVVEIFPPRSSIIGNNNATIATDSVIKYREADYCTGDPAMKDFCELIGVSQIMEHNSISDLIGSLEPGGAATKQFAHYGQNIQNRTFRRWDFGTVENLEHYGTADPPAFDLSTITADVIMHYTVNDALLDERDVLAMAEVMPNTVARKIARESFRHADFVFSSDVRELVTEYIIEYIQYVEDPTNGTDVENNYEPDSAVSTFLVFSLKVYLILYCLIQLY